ncbi:hypothetical protein DdX_17944 [Ditylenchus destructor]|uniref:Uncharacterized protein n=1 Tax=Ditylenchus destructor TaxID=166010 RepID=A0AAD4QVB7_9BILA|nr:hypothetical protein DdX_17944 [Ditylenchus destructor]
MSSSLELFFLGVIMSLMCATNADDVTKRKLKILIDGPAFAYSDMQFQGRLADVLVEAGHEVVSRKHNGLDLFHKNAFSNSESHSVIMREFTSYKEHSLEVAPIPENVMDRNLLHLVGIRTVLDFFPDVP